LGWYPKRDKGCHKGADGAENAQVQRGPFLWVAHKAYKERNKKEGNGKKLNSKQETMIIG